MDEDNKKRTCQGDDVYRQTEDAVLKTVMQYFKDELLPYWGFQEKAVGIAPTELVYLEMQKLFRILTLSWRMALGVILNSRVKTKV